MRKRSDSNNNNNALLSDQHHVRNNFTAFLFVAVVLNGAVQ
ncbi:hypothetical protein [Lysinibacillus sp. G4S2]|nr:hypothetical protein [Lysinibacillus sp. G4S2]